MLNITLQYVPLKKNVAFLAIKQDYTLNLYYRVAFFSHVFSSIFVLLAGFTQFFEKLKATKPSIHKLMGWMYITITIFVSAPSGFFIGIFANGGVFSQIAFCTLAILWILFTVIALQKIMKRKIIEHQKWMIRSFALALSAITLRAWKYLLVAVFHPKPMDVYMIVAWLGWTLNLVIAECYIIYKFKNEKDNKKII